MMQALRTALTFALVFLSIAGSRMAGAGEPDPAELRRAAVRDLLAFFEKGRTAWTLDDKEKAETLSDTLTWQDSDYRLMCLMKWEATDGSRYVLVKRPGVITIPGNPDYKLQILDPDGFYIKSILFRPGNRLMYLNAAIESVDAFGGQLIILEACSSDLLNPKVMERHYYSLVDEQLVLVRLEDPKGKLMRNLYAFKGNRQGPELPRRTRDAWAAAMESLDRALVLQALVWLGGVHNDPSEKEEVLRGDEALEHVQLVDEVRRLPRIQERLQQLKQSKDKWLREAAELAATPCCYRDRESE